MGLFSWFGRLAPSREGSAEPAPISMAALLAERPLGRLLPAVEEFAWQEINRLFEKARLPKPPVLLRDELVTHLLWARHGERLQAALSGHPREAQSEATASLPKALSPAPVMMGEGVTEANVELAAERIYLSARGLAPGTEMPALWADAGPTTKDNFRRHARAALSADPREQASPEPQGDK